MSDTDAKTPLEFPPVETHGLNPAVMEPRVDEATIKKFIFTAASKLDDSQKELFLQLALANNLNPFNGEIYPIAFGNEFSLVTHYGVYLKRAQQTGQLAHWHCENTDEGAKIRIVRKDWEEPFEWEAYYAEFDKGQSSWKKMRKFMIKKVCIAQAFRLCFPETVGSLPYVQEERIDQTGFEEPEDKKVKTAESKKEKVAREKAEKAGKKEDSKPATPVTETKPEKAAGVEEQIIKVKKVSMSKEETGKSKQYYIISMGDTMFSTFDLKIAEEASKIKDKDVEALVLFKTVQAGQNTYYNLLDFKDGGFTVLDPE